MQGDLGDVVAEGKLADVRGIGETLREKITTLVTTGQLPFLDELRAEVPPGLVAMLRLPGLGPKKVKALHDPCSIDTLDEARRPRAMTAEVAKLKGFGAKTQAKILEGIAFLSEVGNRVRIDQALPLGEALVECIRQHARRDPQRNLCGSLRRRRETVEGHRHPRQLRRPAPIMEAFVACRK